MCAISGFIAVGPALVGKRREKVTERMQQIILRSTDRGRDSWGISVLGNNGAVGSFKSVRGYSPTDELRIQDGARIAIVNNRAEPTTEFVKEKTEHDVQPFSGQHSFWYVAHNGTIANDKALIEQHSWTPPTAIDSIVLPGLFEEYGFADGLRKVIGSYAIAAFDKRDPHKLHLATNYKPLVYHHDAELECIFFASFPEYIGSPDFHHIVEVPPYTLAEVTSTGAITKWPLLRPAGKRALVIASSGLDSTVAAQEAKKRFEEIALLHFNYGCRATPNELKAFSHIARAMKVSSLVINTEVFRNHMKSRLLGNTEKVAQGDAGVEFAHEWVPARNLIMLSMATGVAESDGFDTIVLGNNLEESGAYPDNEMIFIRKVNAMLPFATRDGTYIQLEQPVGNLMKREIVKLGLENGSPLELTWSCYEHGDNHCGTCGPCRMRKVAFRINGVRDPVFEHEYSDPFWSDCKPYGLT